MRTVDKRRAPGYARPAEYSGWESTSVTQAKRSKKASPPTAAGARNVAAGQSAATKWMSTILMLLSSILMLTLLFPPFYCFFLAPFALVPFLICIIRRKTLGWKHSLAYYLLGFIFFCSNIWWLAPVTIPGFVLLAAFVALYILVFAIAFHRLVNHLRIPAMVAAPLLWTAIEFARSTFVYGGFPWFMLGNCLAPVPLLIQTADLFGVWGVTFLIVMINGLVVDVLRLPLFKEGRFSSTIGWLLATGTGTCAFAVAYGVFRLQQGTVTPGPRVAVVQENFPQRVKDDPKMAPEIFRRHLELTRQAAETTPAPELIVWPETMIPGSTDVHAMNPSPEQMFDPQAKQLEGTFHLWQMEDFSNTTRIPLLLGIGAVDPQPAPTPERAFEISPKWNSTVLVLPGRGVVQRYDKVHLVPFGEFIPFRGLPLVGPHMVVISPYGVDYSLTAGVQWTRFQLVAGSGTGAKVYQFATPICFEDCMPEPARMMCAPQFSAAHGGTAGRKTDFLVNVSNDGWFYSVELDQHLQAAQLRAVENRVAIARSVNTGNSGFIDSCGRIVKLVQDAEGNSIHAAGTAWLEMPVDSRVTLYSKVGDLLPIWSGILCTLLVGWTYVRPRHGVVGETAKR